jgi:hypothetical protein
MQQTVIVLLVLIVAVVLSAGWYKFYLPKGFFVSPDSFLNATGLTSFMLCLRPVGCRAVVYGQAFLVATNESGVILNDLIDYRMNPVSSTMEFDIDSDFFPPILKYQYDVSRHLLTLRSDGIAYFHGYASNELNDLAVKTETTAAIKSIDAPDFIADFPDLTAEIEAEDLRRQTKALDDSIANGH